MVPIPDVREIARRFNSACDAFDEAITASQARDAERHEAGLVQSAREMGSSLELSVLRCVGLGPAGLPTEPRELDFPRLVDRLRALGTPPISDGLAHRLRLWRGMRNRAEHYPIRVPPLRDLLDALRGARRFLVDAFGEIDLGDPDHPAPSSTRVESPAPAAPVPLGQGHRREPPEAWVRARLDDGLQRLNAGRAEHPPLLEKEVRKELLRAAWALAEHAPSPEGPIPTEGLRATLDDSRRLYVEAGWFLDDASGLRFRDERLPALLVGLELAGRGSGVSGMRRALGQRRRWAEAAWAATSAGDLAVDWLRPLFDGDDLERLPDRVMTACAALAGLEPPRDPKAAELVERAARAATAALVWLVPAAADDDAEAWNAWPLERSEWHRAMLDLTAGTQKLGPAAPIDWKRPEGALGRLVDALGLPLRLDEDAARAVTLLARPWPRDGVSPLDEPFFEVLFSTEAGLAGHLDAPFLEAWVAEIGLRALRQGDARRAERMLVVSGAGHAADFLLGADDLLPDWCEAWECFADAEPAEEAASAWVHGAVRVARSGRLDDAVADFLLRHAPQKLRALGAWEAARAMLGEVVSPSVPPAQADERHARYAAALFALADLGPEAWRRRIDAWTAEPSLPWRLLVEAGAPHDAVARWCVAKLRQKDRDAPHLDGPVGIAASPGVEIPGDGGWQIAFQQAREALDWLLDHGDEGAVTTLADACFAANEAQRMNPVVAKYAGLGVPLSRVLWGRVMGRPGGRAALFARIERGAGLGAALHFLPDHALLSAADGVWEALAVELSIALVEGRRRPLADEAAEAARLLAVFEKWMNEQPEGPWRLAPERPSWADPAMRAAKTVLVFCGARNDLDVTGPLHTLLRGVVDDADPKETELLVILGAALDRLCQRPGEPPAALLALSATPKVAARLAHDEARAFWVTLLRHLGVSRVLELLDELALPDLGLGLFDALASIAPEALAQHQERPDLLRAVLVRAAQGRFVPSRAFHERAWARPRRPDEIRELFAIPAGDWLLGLLEHSRGWPDSDREAFLRWLAQRSRDAEVRRRCLQALVDGRRKR